MTDHLRDLRAKDSRCERASIAVVGKNAKRAIDILFVAAVLPFVLPVLLLLAALVFLTGGRPIFYAHPRAGHGGREFRCFKFRTMVDNGDEVLRAYLHDHPQERAVWEAERKLVNDPRVTGIGAFLRQTSLDELPQLLNVLRGETSVVGLARL